MFREFALKFVIAVRAHRHSVTRHPLASWERLWRRNLLQAPQTGVAKSHLHVLEVKLCERFQLHLATGIKNTTQTVIPRITFVGTLAAQFDVATEVGPQRQDLCFAVGSNAQCVLEDASQLNVRADTELNASLRFCPILRGRLGFEEVQHSLMENTVPARGRLCVCEPALLQCSRLGISSAKVRLPVHFQALEVIK